MNQVIRAFEEAMRDDDNRKKFEAAMAEITASGEASGPDEAVSIAARKVLGIEISVLDIQKARAEEEELDQEELDRVSGGELCELCEKDYTCHIFWNHPDDTKKNQACWWNHVCFGIYYCSNAVN